MFILYKKAASEKKKTNGSCESPTLSWPIKEFNVIFGYLSSVYTFIAFVVACSLLPWMLILYVCQNCWKKVWIRWLERKYPSLEFIVRTTARTVVDTPRNQCIISLLLTVEGHCQVQLIKNRVKEEIVERRKGEKLEFPHLKCRLTSRWGNYAWVRNSDKDFRLENHVLLAPSTFKGRPISEQNIQDVTSDLIAKLLPPEVPPWQVLVIPVTEEKSYLLLRLHHLYLSEEGLTLGDLLTIRQTNWESSPVLDGVFRPPVVIPRVYSAISESTSNMWNEIVSQYDPVEKPDVVKHPSLKSCFFLACIVLINSLKTYFSVEKQTICGIIETEIYKRCLTLALVTEGFFNTFSLKHIPYFLVKAIKIPFEIMKLPLHLINLVFDTPVYLYWLYLGHYVVQELVYLFKVIYKAPRVLFEELFLPERPANVHQLQTMSFCGRKVVSWSESVPKDIIKQICYETGATESEVLLSAVAGALRNYFIRAGFSLPESIMTTCNFTAKGQLPGTKPSGFLCLPLPMRHQSPTTRLEETRTALFTAKDAQTVLYLAGEQGLDSGLLLSLSPPLLAKAALYLLSRRYALNVSLVEGAADCSLLWGQPVHRLMYWSPPQANVCMSITVMCYGDTVTLGVMADAQLCPQHVNIAASFPHCLASLASSLSIPWPSHPTA